MKELKAFFFKPLFDMCGMDSKCKHFHSQKNIKKVAAVLSLTLFSHILTLCASLLLTYSFSSSLTVVIAAAIIIMKTTSMQDILKGTKA